MLATLHQKLKGWKTMIAAGFYAGAGLLLELHDSIADLLTSSGVDWKSAVDPQYVPWLLIGTGVTFGVLRYVTRGPLGAKGDAQPAPDVKAGD